MSRATQRSQMRAIRNLEARGLSLAGKPKQKPLWGFAFTITNQAVAILIGPKLFKLWVRKGA